MNESRRNLFDKIHNVRKKAQWNFSLKMETTFHRLDIFEEKSIVFFISEKSGSSVEVGKIDGTSVPSVIGPSSRRQITAENNVFRVLVWMVIVLLVSSIQHCAGPSYRAHRNATPHTYTMLVQSGTCKWQWHFYSRPGRAAPIVLAEF